MQAAPAPGIMQIVVLLQALFGMGGGQAPIGMPPLPEKAIVSRVAPEECLFYMSLAGTARADSASTNKTEQLLAQPEVQAFMASLDSAVRGVIEKNAAGTVEAQDAMHAYALFKAFLTRPWCAFVSEFDVTGNGPLVVKGGMLLYLGDAEEDFKSHLEVLLAKAKSGDITSVSVAGKEFSRAESDDGLTLTWGFQKGIFVAGLGDGSVEAMPERIGTRVPSWLAELKRQLPVARPSMVTFANLTAMREKLFAAMATDAPAESETARKVVATLGLDKVKSFKAVSGMDADGMVEKSLIETEGPLPGPLAAVFGGKLASADLDPIPDDAVTAVAIRINATELFKALRETAEAVQPGTSAKIKEEGAKTVALAGFQSFEDALATLGETWTFSNSSTDPESPYGGVILTVEVKEEFSRIQQMVEALLMMISANEGAPKLVKVQVAGMEISTLEVPSIGPGAPITPCWCVKEGRLVVAMCQAGMEKALSRASSGSRIAQVPRIADALAGDTPPSILIYSDTKASVETVYPRLPALLAEAALAGGETGIDPSALKLPRMSTLLPYAQPTVILASDTPSGIQVEQYATMPGFSSAAAVPIVAAVLLPAVDAGRKAAEEAAQRATGSESPGPFPPGAFE